MGMPIIYALSFDIVLTREWSPRWHTSDFRYEAPSADPQLRCPSRYGGLGAFAPCLIHGPSRFRLEWTELYVRPLPADWLHLSFVSWSGLSISSLVTRRRMGVYYESRQSEIYGGTISLIVLATCAVVLRLIARQKTAAKLWWDDFSIVAALVSEEEPHILLANVNYLPDLRLGTECMLLDADPLLWTWPSHQCCWRTRRTRPVAQILQSRQML